MKRILIALTIAIVFVTMFALVACGKVKLELDAPTGIKYDVDSGQISWNPVQNAAGYNIRINDGETYPVTGTVFPYRATTDSFTVTISAVSNITEYISSNDATTTFSKMNSIDELFVGEDGVVSWNGIEGATAYSVAIDGKTANTVYDTNYRLMPVGTHSIKVKPIVEGSDSFYASWSQSKTLTVLAQVNKDNIIYADGYIQWQAVSGAKSYDVLINGQAVSAAIEGTKVVYESDNKNFSVQIRAIGDHVISFDGASSEQKNFVYLDTITNISVVDGILSWDAINNADGYKIKLNGIVLNETFTTCQYNRLVAEQNIVFQVMPINNNNAYFANWSVEKNVLLLRSPTLQWNDSVELDGEAKNSIFWDGIANAGGYSIKVIDPNGKETVETFGESERSYANAYLDAGEYKVSIKANASSITNNVYDSIYSQPITVRRLSAPRQTENNFIVSNSAKLSEGFTINFTKVAGATSYKLFKDDTAQTTSMVNQFQVGDLVQEGETAEQTYNYKVQAIGSINRASGTINVTLNSLSSASLSADITVLATPSDLSISGTVLQYGAISKSTGYTVAVGGDTKFSSETTYDLSFLNAGSYNVSVCARGNGSTVLPSNYTAALNVERLAAPTDIRILTTDAAEGQLSYSGVLNATSYSAVFDNNGVEIPVNEIDNMQGYITTKGTTIYLISNANVYNSAGTVYYMTSRPSATKTFIKLQTPSFGSPAFTNTQFIWNKPDNINEKVYTPSYEVFNAADELYNGDQNGTTMDISYLDAGTYTFKVKAIGDGTQYINSDVSEPRTITKLATPNVTLSHNTDGYGVYQWSAVVDATKYNISIDGVDKGSFAHESGKTYQYLPDFNRIKTYTVSVIAIGDNGYTTINSNPCIINQDVQQLVEPDFSITYDALAYHDDGNILVDITRESPNAMGYCYTVGDASTPQIGEGCLHHEKCPSSVGTYQVSVYAIGGDYDENGTFYIDSQRHGGNSSYQITLLAEPNANSINISQDGKLTWATISGTNRYAITITVEGDEYLTKTIVTQPNYVISNYADEVRGKHWEVTIQAIGNDTTVISSKETTRSWN